MEICVPKSKYHLYGSVKQPHTRVFFKKAKLHQRKNLRAIDWLFALSLKLFYGGGWGRRKKSTITALHPSDIAHPSIWCMPFLRWCAVPRTPKNRIRAIATCARRCTRRSLFGVRGGAAWVVFVSGFSRNALVPDRTSHKRTFLIKILRAIFLSKKHVYGTSSQIPRRFLKFPLQTWRQNEENHRFPPCLSQVGTFMQLTKPLSKKKNYISFFLIKKGLVNCIKFLSTPKAWIFSTPKKTPLKNETLCTRSTTVDPMQA